MTEKQSEYIVTQGANPPLLSDGRKASTRTLTAPITDQRTGQSASLKKTRTANSTRSFKKPSTDTLATKRQELELLTGMLNDIRLEMMRLNLLTVKRLPSTGEMVLVISRQLEDLMRLTDE